MVRDSGKIPIDNHVSEPIAISFLIPLQRAKTACGGCQMHNAGFIGNSEIYILRKSISSSSFMAPNTKGCVRFIGSTFERNVRRDGFAEVNLTIIAKGHFFEGENRPVGQIQELFGFIGLFEEHRIQGEDAKGDSNNDERKYDGGPESFFHGGVPITTAGKRQEANLVITGGLRPIAPAVIAATAWRKGTAVRRI
jgi:hypothetical protein